MLYKMVFCTVKGCKSSESNHGISFHRFPKSPETRRLWLLAVGKNLEQPVGRRAVCSLHFEKDHFRKLKGRTYLEKGALPTVNLPTSEDDEIAEENDGNQCDEEFIIKNEDYDDNKEILRRVTSNNRNQCDVGEIVEGNDGNQYDEELHEEFIIKNEDYNDNKEILRRVIANSGNQYDVDEHEEMAKQNVDYKDYEAIQPKRITYLQEIHNYSKKKKNKNWKLIELRRKIKTQAQLIRRQKKKIADLKSIIVQLRS